MRMRDQGYRCLASEPSPLLLASWTLAIAVFRQDFRCEKCRLVRIAWKSDPAEVGMIASGCSLGRFIGHKMTISSPCFDACG